VIQLSATRSQKLSFRRQVGRRHLLNLWGWFMIGFTTSIRKPSRYDFQPHWSHPSFCPEWQAPILGAVVPGESQLRVTRRPTKWMGSAPSGTSSAEKMTGPGSDGVQKSLFSFFNVQIICHLALLLVPSI